MKKVSRIVKRKYPRITRTSVGGDYMYIVSKSPKRGHHLLNKDGSVRIFSSKKKAESVIKRL